MGFCSFLGRVLFSSLFILSAWQMFYDFDADGGPAAKELAPKFTVFKKNISSRIGVGLPDVDAGHLVATALTLKGVGGFLFVFGNTFGAYLLLCYLAFTAPILYDFYNYKPQSPEFIVHLNDFLQSMALFGALLFFLGMKNAVPRRPIKKTPKTKTV